MSSRDLLKIFAVFLYVSIGWTVSFSQEPPESGVAETTEKENLIHYGDLIDIDVVGSIEYDWRGTLNPEGFLDGFESSEPVFALCRSENEVAEGIVKELEKNLKNPQIIVKILDKSNRAVSVFNGAVRKPQRFRIKRPVYLNELLILSGGFTDKMNGEIRIFRPKNLSCGTPQTETGAENGTNGLEREKFVKTSVINGSKIINLRITDLLSGNKEANPQILSGDLITVLEAAPLYVIGGVNRPKQIPFRSGITLTRAIDSAGGLSKDSLSDSITIFRREAGDTKVLNFDLEKIKKGLTEDFVLLPYDIIEVAQKGKEKKKMPPAIKTNDITNDTIINLPLTIID